jgi:hypothetical protein
MQGAKADFQSVDEDSIAQAALEKDGNQSTNHARDEQLTNPVNRPGTRR